MKKPEEFEAIQLARIPIQLEFVRDIDEFDGPLLSEFRSSEGETFLYYWCDCNELTNRWLVVRAPRRDLFGYLVGRFSLRSLVRDCPDGFLYIVDLDSNASPQTAWFIYADDVPENYLPGQGSVRQPGTGIHPGFQDVSVDEKWGYEQVAAYPRKYLQAYAFHTAFGRGGDPHALQVDYRLTTGWVFRTLFERMLTNAPSSRRASLDEVSFSSPGYLRFRVEPMIAEGLLDAVRLYLRRRSQLRPEVEDLRAWVNGHYDMEEDAAGKMIRQISESVGVDGSALLRHIDTIEHAGKVLVSYLARLEFLAVNQADQTAMLVGLPREHEGKLWQRNREFAHET